MMSFAIVAFAEDDVVALGLSVTKKGEVKFVPGDTKSNLDMVIMGRLGVGMGNPVHTVDIDGDLGLGGPLFMGGVKVIDENGVWVGANIPASKIEAKVPDGKPEQQGVLRDFDFSTFLRLRPFDNNGAEFGTGEGKVWYRGVGGTSNVAPENSIVVVGNNLYVHNGDVKTNQFLQMYSWPEFGTGDAKLWFDGEGGKGDAKGRLHMVIQGKDNIQFDEDGSIEAAGSILATPIMGQWHPSAHLRDQAANTFATIKLDVEQYNTNPDYLARTSDNQGVTIKKAGYYQITARTLVYVPAGDYGHFYLRNNGGNLDIDHGHISTQLSWDDRHINYIGHFNANDVISLVVKHIKRTSYGYHLGPIYTHLNIRRVN